MSTKMDETARLASLVDAQDKAKSLFKQIEQDLIRPGKTEKQISDEVHALATEKYNVKTFWHKRIVRSGANTLLPYQGNPPDRTIEPNDILFVDLGPVFEAWEADIGRTFVLGSDPAKRRVCDALEPVWNNVKAHFDKHDNITGEELYMFARERARKAGYGFGVHAGHLIGDFPHERIPKGKVTIYITEGNNQPLRSLEKDGKKRHWILEIHLIDNKNQIGGFFEQLLTIEDSDRGQNSNAVEGLVDGFAQLANTSPKTNYLHGLLKTIWGTIWSSPRRLWQLWLRNA